MTRDISYTYYMKSDISYTYYMTSDISYMIYDKWCIIYIIYIYILSDIERKSWEHKIYLIGHYILPKGMTHTWTTKPYKNICTQFSLSPMLLLPSLLTIKNCSFSLSKCMYSDVNDIETLNYKHHKQLMNSSQNVIRVGTGI